MKMKSLDGSGIAERGRNLSGLRREILREPLFHADHFQEIPAIVRPQIVGFSLNAWNQMRRIGAGDQFPDSGFRGRDGNDDFGARTHYCQISTRTGLFRNQIDLTHAAVHVDVYRYGRVLVRGIDPRSTALLQSARIDAADSAVSIGDDADVARKIDGR